MPRIALNTTAEKVLNLSNKPNTAFGNKAVPIGPESIAKRQIMAQFLRDFIPSFLALAVISIKDASDNITTSTVTIRCIAFWGFDDGASFTHGNKVYPTLHTHWLAAKA